MMTAPAMNDIFVQLESAIVEAGLWYWWYAEPDHSVFQIECARVRMHIPPKRPTKPPCDRFALGFFKPRHIEFLEFSDQAEPDWRERMHRDELPPVKFETFGGGQFVVNDDARIANLLAGAVRTHELIRPPEPDAATPPSPPSVKCAFRTSSTGLGAFVVAENLRLVTESGAIALEQVPELRRAWWAYWKRYWRALRNGQPLPEDINCSLSFPAEPLDDD